MMFFSILKYSLRDFDENLCPVYRQVDTKNIFWIGFYQIWMRYDGKGSCRIKIGIEKKMKRRGWKIF